jgi:hypothetical protein
VRRLAVVALALLAAAPACSGATLQRARAPVCETDTGVGTVALFAQAVPSAEQLPCVSSYPAGWSFGRSSTRDGRARFTLSNDRAGIDAVRVTLSPRCSTAGATEIDTDEPGTRRFEKVDRVLGGLSGSRIYTFEGGCVTYDVDLPKDGGALVNEVSVAVSFMTRARVVTEIRRLSNGVESL